MAAAMEVSSTSQEMLSSDGTLVDERERQKVVREAAKAAAEKKEREKVAYEVEEEVRVAFASQDLRGD